MVFRTSPSISPLNRHSLHSAVSDSHSPSPTGSRRQSHMNASRFSTYEPESTASYHLLSTSHDFSVQRFSKPSLQGHLGRPHVKQSRPKTSNGASRKMQSRAWCNESSLDYFDTDLSEHSHHSETRLRLVLEGKGAGTSWRQLLFASQDPNPPAPHWRSYHTQKPCSSSSIGFEHASGTPHAAAYPSETVVYTPCDDWWRLTSATPKISRVSSLQPSSPALRENEVLPSLALSAAEDKPVTQQLNDVLDLFLVNDAALSVSQQNMRDVHLQHQVETVTMHSEQSSQFTDIKSEVTTYLHVPNNATIDELQASTPNTSFAYCSPHNYGIEFDTQTAHQPIADHASCRKSHVAGAVCGSTDSGASKANTGARV